MGHVELQPEDVDESITALFAAIKRTWSAFCDTTSIHGLKYTKDVETNKYIRFIWILITLIMFICAIVMVFTFYMDYRQNPTRMNVENDYTPISNILFPAVVICPKIIYNIQQTKAFLEQLNLPNYTTTSDILDILDVHYGFMYDNHGYNWKDINLLEKLLSLNNLNILDFVKKISWSCDDIIYRCRYKDEIVHCNTLFQVANTYTGLCCSFNLNYSDIDFSNRYGLSGLRNGLSLILRYNDNMFNRFYSYAQGFNLLIQETNAFPSAHSTIKLIPLNEEVFIPVRPTERFCSQAVKNLAFEERQCILSYEKKLTHFPIYNGANCELNCRIENMLKICKCYAYFFSSNQTSYRICTYKDIPCLIDNYGEIVGRLKSTQCSCFKTCEKIEYDVQVSSAALQLNMPTIDAFYDGIGINFSVVHIYLASQIFRRVRHDLLSNMVTLVSNLGSAFSLFVGMSMVSVVEIVFYFSIILKKYYQQEIKARTILFERKIQTETDQNMPEQVVELEKRKRQRCFERYLKKKENKY